MERLDFTEGSKYNPVEASIHLNRYLTTKQYVRGKRVLDIACGEGYGSKLMKNWGAASVVGVDTSEEALTVANNYFSGEGISFLNHTAEELPFENDSFDVVVSFETVEHLDHPENFLREVARVVKFDGVVLISCPNDPYYSKNDPAFSNPFHKHAFNFFEFKELTEHYLGRDASWYFGFGLSGFSTIPMKDIRLPEGEEALPANMLSMFDYECDKVIAAVPSDRYLNYWNANYYLGIWGCDAAKMEERAVLYAKEFFLAEEDNPIWADIVRWKKEYEREQRDAGQERVREREYTKKLEQECQECRTMLDECQTCLSDLERQKNEADDARKQTELEKQGLVSQVAAAKEYAGEWEQKCQKYQKTLEDHQKQSRELETAYQTEISELKRKLHVLMIEEERTSNLLNLAEEEKRQIWQRIDAQQNQIRELDTERWKAWDECTSLRNELDGLLNAKSIKLVFLFWRIRDKIFRRKK